MKKILIILLFIPTLVYSQEYPILDTLNFGKNVKEVLVYRKHASDKKENLIKKYVFNPQKQQRTIYTGYNSSYQYKDEYEYQNDKLISYKSYSKCSLVDNIDWLVVEKIDSTMYEKVNPEEIDWEKSANLNKYMTLEYYENGKVSSIKLYEQMSEGESYLDEEIKFIYNSKGQIESKTYSEKGHPNVIKFQAFKPSSLELNDSIKMLSGTMRKKRFYYFNDTTLIKYFVNGIHTGNEYQIFNADEETKTKTYTVYNPLNDTLSLSVETFNENQLLISRKNILQKGYNGFGFSLDVAAGDEYFYEYDNLKRIKKVDCYDIGEFYYSDTYIVNKK